MKLYCGLIFLILGFPFLSQAQPSTLEKFIGQWSFESCTGEITQYKDHLVIESIKGGIKITQKALEGPQNKNRVLIFSDKEYRKDSFLRNSKKPLQRYMITKIMDGKPIAASTWSPLRDKKDREFLSTVIAEYDVKSDKKLHISYLGNSYSKGKTEQSSAKCSYNKVK